MEAPFDVLVIGAGPGGSNAAAVALRHGLSVAQVDRCSFPRVKPCGGGFTVKSSHALRFDPEPILRGEFTDVQVNLWQRKVNRFSHQGSALLRMVERAEFDSWLVDRNLDSPGFRFFGRERVLEIRYDGLFRVRTSNRVLLGRQLIGADGAYSLVNRTFSIARPKGRAVAVEVTLPRDRASLRQESPPCFDLGAVERGYGWVFPKDDHWNVGLYTVGRSRTLRAELRTYISAKGFQVASDPLETFVSHQFPYGGYQLSVPEAPVYLVGDAGGFGDALTGEGIYHALESGRIAGETIHDALAGRVSHHAYYRRLRRTVLTDTFLTYHIARRFYRNLNRASMVLENPVVSRPLLRAYAEGRTLGESIGPRGFIKAAVLLPRVFMARRKSPAGGLRASP
jgi:geranylgeranyl reductase family protein